MYKINDSVVVVSFCFLCFFLRFLSVCLLVIDNVVLFFLRSFLLASFYTSVSFSYRFVFVFEDSSELNWDELIWVNINIVIFGFGHILLIRGIIIWCFMVCVYFSFF